MATCPSCGYHEIGLTTNPCYICQRPICQNCGMAFGYKEETVFTPPTYMNVLGVPVAGSGGTLSSRPSQYFGVCSWACFDQWVGLVLDQGQQPTLNGDKYILAGITLYPGTAQRAAQLFRDHRTRTGLDRAQKMLQAGDYEGAAQEYEALEMWDKAADARRQDRTVTQVQVNLNQLVDQLRDAGVSTDYACPTCGSHIRITGETSLATLTTCSYCGSVIRTTDLVDFLSKVVGSK